MKQILQDLKKGSTILADIPTPKAKKGHILIESSKSLVSLGTERMLVEFGKANYLEKAKQQPDRVKMVIDKIRTDGFWPTVNTVLNKLDQPLPLGYSNVGKVIAVGEGVDNFQISDRVVSNGPHAEIVNVSKNLVAKIPDNVTDEEASFTVVGAIALQGIRLCKPTFGETIVVYGLGLIGLIAAELLKANGCRVIGIDIDEKKIEIAHSKGIETINPANGQDPVKAVNNYTSEIGADGVVITASAKNDEIIHQSALMSRKRGRIILIGVIGLNINRADFYEKELSFQVSCSYGPGRYDDEYEKAGIDYPLPFVRWTEKRNFEAILQAISSHLLDVKPLITSIVELKNYEEIYNNLNSKDIIASVISYPAKGQLAQTIKISDVQFEASDPTVGIIGAGNFAQVTILPALKKAKANIKYIASASGVSASSLAKKYKIQFSTSDYKEILNDKDIKLAMITTRHNLHAEMIIASLKSGKNVFVEKPLALNKIELADIIETYRSVNELDNDITITVGYNRRFSPHAIKIKSYLKDSSPLNIIANMNAGAIPSSVWVNDMKIGGGRIIGEACHYIDLMIYLTGSLVSSVCMNALGPNPKENTDNASIMLKFANGSNAVINYFSNGSKSYSKERIEVYNEERVFILDNFRTTRAFGVQGFSSLKTKQDKGHNNQFVQLVNKLSNGGKPLIPFEEIINSTKASFAAIESLKLGEWIKIEY